MKITQECTSYILIVTTLYYFSNTSGYLQIRVCHVSLPFLLSFMQGVVNTNVDEEKSYHVDCFKCCECSTDLTKKDGFHFNKDDLYCEVYSCARTIT